MHIFRLYFVRPQISSHNRRDVIKISELGYRVSEQEGFEDWFNSINSIIPSHNLTNWVAFGTNSEHRNLYRDS